jgi:hypothetical protein
MDFFLNDHTRDASLCQNHTGRIAKFFRQNSLGVHIYLSYAIAFLCRAGFIAAEIVEYAHEKRRR